VRRIVGLVSAIVVVGIGAGATTAWGHPGPARREAAKACVADARAAHPDADRAAIREAARPCLEALGLPGRARTPEQRAARQRLRACVRDVRQAHPDADARALGPLIKDCVTG